MIDHTPDPTDQRVGARILARRRQLGMSQSELAGRLNLSFQQIQKYERGANRVSASTLHRIANILDAPLAWFFETLHVAADGGPPMATPFDDFLAMPDAAQIAALWPQLSPNLRPRFIALLREISMQQDSTVS